MLHHSWINLEKQKNYQDELKFNGIYSKDDLSDKIKDEAYVINLDEYSDIGTQWIALYALKNDISYFDSFLYGSHWFYA